MKKKSPAARKLNGPGREAAGSHTGWDVTLIFRALAILLAGLWIHWPDLHGDWMGDDDLYITNNPLLHDPARLWKAWFQPGSFIEYYPIQESLQWLQWKLWHKDTFGYHLTNVLLHVTSALLVWRLLQKLGLKFAWLGGLIFVVHPMTVDSVALINEFKTSLSLPPFLLAMMAWIDFEEGNDRRHYLLAVGFFVMAMLCKITMMAFPFVIPLYAWWKRGRIGWRDVGHAVPFLFVSIVLGLASIHAANVYEPERLLAGADPDQLAGHPVARFVLIGEITLFYLGRAFFPYSPTTVYPEWHPDPYSFVAYLPWLLLLGIIGSCFLCRATWGRHALLGFGFFLVMLGPFSGVHWVSYMNISWGLEHLLYLPLIGLVGLTIAGFDQIHRQLAPQLRPVSVAAVVIVVGLLAWESENYAAKFADQETLARYTIQLYPAWSVGYVSLGSALMDKGRPFEARQVYERYLSVDPHDAELQGAYGEALQMTGDLAGAIQHLQLAAQLRPRDGTIHSDLGTAYETVNRLPEALAQYELAVQFDPHVAKIRFDYALCLAKIGRVPDAIEQYHQVLAIDPQLNVAHDALGLLYQQSGRKAEASAQFEQALAIDANDRLAQNGLATAHSAQATP